VGNISLATLNVCYALACIFGPTVVEKIGVKKTLVISALCYCGSFLSFSRPNFRPAAVWKFLTQLARLVRVRLLEQFGSLQLYLVFQGYLLLHQHYKGPPLDSFGSRREYVEKLSPPFFRPSIAFEDPDLISQYFTF
jgi:hypothetical protein